MPAGNGHEGPEHDAAGHSEAHAGAAEGQGAEHGEAQHGEADGHGATDPHAWQAVPNAVVYVRNIAEAFCTADPAGCDSYKANAAAYQARLDALDAEIKAAVAAIPQERRVVITSHDAFGYFGHEYGIDFIAPKASPLNPRRPRPMSRR